MKWVEWALKFHSFFETVMGLNLQKKRRINPKKNSQASVRSLSFWFGEYSHSFSYSLNLLNGINVDTSWRYWFCINIWLISLDLIIGYKLGNMLEPSRPDPETLIPKLKGPVRFFSYISIHSSLTSIHSLPIFLLLLLIFGWLLIFNCSGYKND
jgi:hypothetical protein